ncbi:hypothetical protein N7470_006212 [Penicillium chermesinum]|nr:hypothetical protein N7470_006212 [Penicillium chermesinum]
MPIRSGWRSLFSVGGGVDYCAAQSLEWGSSYCCWGRFGLRVGTEKESALGYTVPRASIGEWIYREIVQTGWGSRGWEEKGWFLPSSGSVSR